MAMDFKCRKSHIAQRHGRLKVELCPLFQPCKQAWITRTGTGDEETGKRNHKLKAWGLLIPVGALKAINPVKAMLHTLQPRNEILHRLGYSCVQQRRQIRKFFQHSVKKQPGDFDNLNLITGNGC